MTLFSEKSRCNVKHFLARTSSYCWSCVPWSWGLVCSRCTSNMNISTVGLADPTWNPYGSIVKAEGDILWSLSEVPCHSPASLVANLSLTWQSNDPFIKIPGWVHEWFKSPLHWEQSTHNCLIQLLLDLALVLPMVSHGAVRPLWASE